MLGQRTFFSIIKLVSRGKREFYLFYYKAFLKDRVLFKKTQPSIEIDVIVVKKHIFLNFFEKYIRLKWKKKVNVILSLLNMPDYAYINRIDMYASDPKYAKILNMAKF